MGNCWPKPVDNLPSTNKPLSPANGEPKSSSKKSSSESTENNKIGGGGGGDDGKDKYTLPPPPPPPPPTVNNGSAGVVQETESTAPPPEVSTSGPEAVLQKLKMFTYAELKSATRNFRQDTVLGEGGFGTVFRGWVDEKTLAPSKVGVGMAVAVKKSNPDSQQGLKEWQAEVKFLGKFRHPNLVRLLGYCCEDKEFLLVYEYMPKRSLENHLFRKGAGDPLPWDIRLRIATDAARGLAFLHTTEKQVIYRDFKAANILLDGNFNAKLSDFGLAKAGPLNGNSHVTTQVVGTYGYAAPEYMATGHLYVKSDVYGFGVVLLEMISGRRVLDLNRPNGEHNLVDWAKPLLTSKKKLRKVMDSRLEGQYPSRAAVQIAELIQKCLEPDPKKRPSMEHILESLEDISTLKMKSKESEQPVNHRRPHQYDRRSPLHDKCPSGPNGGTATAQVHNQLSTAKTY